MVMANIGGGVSWAIPLSETFNVVFDTGMALQVDAFMSADINGTVVTGLGIIGDVAFQYNISKLLRLEAGVNLDLTAGSGVYSFTDKELKMRTSDVIVSASPYIALGIKWGSGINRRKKANGREQTGEKKETDQQSYMDLFYEQTNYPSAKGIAFRFKEHRDIETLRLVNNTDKVVIILTYSLYRGSWVRVDNLRAAPYGVDRDTDGRYEDGIVVALVPVDDTMVVQFVRQDGADVYFEVKEAKSGD
jgi:hypothetical protein